MLSRSPSPAVELQGLRRARIVAQGRETRLPLKRAVALLAYLAFNTGPVPRSHLAAMLWPDAGEAQGRTRLRRLVYTIERSGRRKDPVPGQRLPRALCADRRDRCASVHAIRPPRGRRRRRSTTHTLAEARQWLVRARHPLMQGIAFGSEIFDDWLKVVSIEHEHLLARLLERLIDALGRRGEYAPALDLAEALMALDVYREPSYVLLMQLHALQGHGAGVEAAYMRCAEALRAEFGIKPGPHTEQAYLRLTDDLKRLSSQPGGAAERAFCRRRLRHRRLHGARGRRADPGDLPGFVCHIEIALEYPALRAFVEALGGSLPGDPVRPARCRLVRTAGRHEHAGGVAADIAAILEHAGVPRAWLFGSSEGGLGAMRLAVDHPDRVQGLCLFGSLARGSAAPDYPWALPASAYDVWLQRLIAGWGGPVGIETFAPSEKDDPALRAWWARIVRHAASPGALKTILGGLRDADLRADLAASACPTLVMHRRGDRAVRFEAGEHLAQNIPGAVWHPLEGVDHFWWCGDSEPVIRAILEFAAR